MRKKFVPGMAPAGSDKITFALNNITNSDDQIGRMEYIVKNEGNKKVDLNFGSSMTYDFYITDENGHEVYRDSDGKVYMQVIKTITLMPGDKKVFLVKLPKLDPGAYTLTIFLAAKGYSNQKTALDFKVK